MAVDQFSIAEITLDLQSITTAILSLFSLVLFSAVFYGY